MEEFFASLARCPLFEGIDPLQYQTMIDCLHGKTVTVKKGNPVFLEGSPAQFVGVLLFGSLQVVRDDYYGNRSVLTVLQPGDLFAEAFSFAGITEMPVSVIAVKDSKVLLLDCRALLGLQNDVCGFHSRLLRNLLKEMASKNLRLSQKIRYMSQKTTRDKLKEYLLDQAKIHKSTEFTIPLDRQALADYLGVERSAMSAEIGRLKKAGQIDTKGSWFSLKTLGKDD
jgi:CRP-like cAMP-binding protein